MNIEDGVIFKYHPHPIKYLSIYFVGLTLVAIGFFYSILLILAGLLIFFIGEVSRRAITFYILESGVARGYHLFSTSRKFAEYGNIQNMEVSQSLVDNIFGIGSVSFDTSGSHLIEVHFDGVKNPYKIEKIVREKMAIK